MLNEHMLFADAAELIGHAMKARATALNGVFVNSPYAIPYPILYNSEPIIYSSNPEPILVPLEPSFSNEPIFPP